MFLPKLLFLALCCCMTYGSQSSEEVEAMLADPIQAKILREAVRKSYNEDKLSMISDMLKENQESFSNVSLFGSQNIYGNNGDIKEIRTVELHIPSTKTIKDEEGDDEESMAEIKNLFIEISKIGLVMEVATEEYDDDGDLTDSVYLSNDISYGLTDGVHTLNKTIRVDDIKLVEEAIKQIKKDHSPVAIHKYDSNRQFLSEESSIVPEYVTSITGVEGEVDPEILKSVQEKLASIHLKYQNDKDKVPSELSRHLGLKFPATDFYVFYFKPEVMHIRKDFMINVEFDFLDWEEGDVDLYTIIGVKKVRTVRSI